VTPPRTRQAQNFQRPACTGGQPLASEAEAARLWRRLSRRDANHAPPKTSMASEDRMAPHVRKDIWRLGPGWSDEVLWYARAVGAMLERPIEDPTGWRYLAAIHGFNHSLWRAFDYIADSPAPPSGVRAPWEQCRRRNWQFPLWHRGYVAAFEAIVRATIVKLGGPASWALPYWNYSDGTNAKARDLPPAFEQRTLPDGQPNPLFVAQRYGAGAGKIVITPNDVKLDALCEPLFAGAPTGGSPGFGGCDAAFIADDGGTAEGFLEQAPHDVIHGRVGGVKRGGSPNDAMQFGLMSIPETAALDPVFWIHHANIDRLWEIWLRRQARHLNPAAKASLAGLSKQKFVFPRPDGALDILVARDLLSANGPNLDYVYEDVSDPPTGADRRTLRPDGRAAPKAFLANVASGATIARARSAELVGANDGELRLDGRVAEAAIRLDRKMVAKLAGSLHLTMTRSVGPKEPDRVYLNLENVRGANDAAVFEIYVDVPSGAIPAEHPDCLAGVVSLFGVGCANRIDGGREGNGIGKTLDITHIFDALHLRGASDRDNLSVRIVPTSDVRPEDGISVGRISIRREGR
jgi:tyrosinase